MSFLKNIFKRNKNKIKTTEKVDSLREKNDGISNNFLSELYTPTLDLSIDYSEIYIDDIINNDAIREIPIIKSIVGVVKGGISINQFWFAKKLLTFIKDFNDGKVSQEKLESFRMKIHKDPKYSKRITEKLMIFIDKNIEITQTKITANLFKAFINEQITYEEFNNILISLDKLHPSSFDFFFDLEKNNFEIGQGFESKDRNWSIESLILSSGFGYETSDWWSGLKLSQEGRKLFEFGIKPLK